MWFLHIWPTLILAMRISVTVASQTNTVSSHFGNGGKHVARQALSAPLSTTTIIYSSAASPTLSRPSVASNPAIVIPFLPSLTATTSSSNFLPTSALSSVSSSKNAITIIVTSLSSTPSPTPSAQNTTGRLPIKFIYLIPTVALMGVILGSLIGWVIYRCMTRKLRIPKDDGALLIGPRYIAIQEPERHQIQGHHNKRGGQPTQMKNSAGVVPASSHFLWPSVNEKPTFHPDRGFHVPDEYLHEGDPSLTLPLTTPSNTTNTNVNTRRKLTRTTRTSKSVRTLKSTQPTPAGPSHNVFPSPTSDTTSLALLELYESDEEEETRRKEREVPWESLRHKSIKRGIIEQVRKEGKWMDSLRGLAGPTLAGSRPEATVEEGNMLLGGPGLDDSMEVDNHVGRRLHYTVPDSDPFADSPARTHSISPKKRPIARSRRTDSTTATFPASSESHGVGFQIIPESAPTTPNHSPRSSFAWLKKAGASHVTDKSTRPATNSRSTSPFKRTSNSGVDVCQVPRRDILPLSPAQLMSPPLQSQICFTPIHASSARVVPQRSRDSHPKSRVPSPTKPLMISSASKSKRKVRSPYNIPKPSPSDTQHEVSRGRALQRTTTTRLKGSVAESRGELLEDPIKKVERIMASSWSARDLGQEGMRDLSPTGFGRRL